MTDSDDQTRPISVAELLAKNGTIGAPPAGGRRRRRKGNSDAVTVAELTGEIPIVNTGSMPVVQPAPEPPPAPTPTPEPPAHDESADTAEPADTVEPAADAEPTEATEPALTDAEADYRAHLQSRDVDPDPIDFKAPTRRPPVATPAAFASPSIGAEQMSPDPVVDDDELLDLGTDVGFGGGLDDADDLDDLAPADDLDDLDDLGGVDDAAEAADAADTPRPRVSSYSRSDSDTLFGGQSVADEAARRGPRPGPEDIDLGPDAKGDRAAGELATAETPAEAGEATESGGSAVVKGIWVVVQCVLAVAFGAGLFIAFDQLWRWNTIVALVLSVLVILGLVVGVRVVRKTEDIGSTLIAVAVGALVTLGPLALLQSH
ncbi:hypothetical protein MMAD_08570 [Mycolicibacterium madagascariense]|uniref:FUSC family protein n=1 Tax=Mycolicibacterium madagascariense TaxID=212765 RepID=A0A7I7XAU4_9MYCO|nr:hypothetical protein [Mycolicibacterium madagascariense]MCV7014851.1 hypothetical protein [Mycolicibacterium madagascariense]BBZ26562.1 hypothetical protein MMAD_08570 [Mycolicibacterium madagascariense]